jgi:hypothetical protein
MLKVSPRMNPTGVAIPASSMARLDSADTAATIGIPAQTAFWTISNDALLTQRR